MLKGISRKYSVTNVIKLDIMKGVVLWLITQMLSRKTREDRDKLSCVGPEN